MPVGTVMVKSFGFDGKLIETRLLVHPDATTWNGYSYKWNEAQTDATVVPADEDLLPINTRASVTFNTGKQPSTGSSRTASTATAATRHRRAARSAPRRVR